LRTVRSWMTGRATESARADVLFMVIASAGYRWAIIYISNNDKNRPEGTPQRAGCSENQDIRGMEAT
jgi:hypothetical protein